MMTKKESTTSFGVRFPQSLYNFIIKETNGKISDRGKVVKKAVEFYKKFCEESK